MNPTEILQAAPVTNLPDLLGLHHGNPLGIPPLALLLFILAVTLVMGIVNYTIRYRGQSQRYPLLYTLYGVSFVALMYYCFQADLPQYLLPGAASTSIRIGWFTDPDIVTLPLALVGLVAATLVLNVNLAAVMQITAQISYVGGMQGRKWKEWKSVLVVIMLPALAAGISLALQFYQFAYWSLIVMLAVTLVLVIVKILRDWHRCKSPLYGLCGGLIFFLGILPIEILTVECIHGLVYFAIVIVASLCLAKARKKKSSSPTPDDAK